jgi:hypothetical protein
MEELREKLDSLQRIGESFQAIQAHMTPSAGAVAIPTATQKTTPAPHPGGTNERPDEAPGRAGAFDPPITAAAHVPQAAANNGGGYPWPKMGLIDRNEPHPNNNINVHEWLIGRLAAIEDDQRTRWCKILDLVRGR